jgi:hypothetical protein
MDLEYPRNASLLLKGREEDKCINIFVCVDPTDPECECKRVDSVEEQPIIVNLDLQKHEGMDRPMRPEEGRLGYCLTYWIRTVEVLIQGMIRDFIEILFFSPIPLFYWWLWLSQYV